MGATILCSVLACAQVGAAQDVEDPEVSTVRRWLVPEAAPNRVAFDAGIGLVPRESTWLLLDGELDHESGFMARAAFASNLRDASRPRETFGYAALGYRWRGLYELGAVAFLAGGDSSNDTGSMWAGGPGVYVGIGAPLGLRWTFALGNVIAPGPGGHTSALALSYELQVPVLVANRFRLLLMNRGFFTFEAPTTFAHRVQLEAIFDDRWKLFGGALFDPDVGLTFGVGVSFD